LPFDFLEVALSLPRTDEAVSMLFHYSNRPENQRDLATAGQIVTRLGSLPIAIKAAGGLVYTGRLPNLSSLLTWLKEQGLDGVRLEDWELTDFLAGLLKMVTADGRDLFGLCGIFSSGQIDLTVFNALAGELGLPVNALGELANLSLVEWNVSEDQLLLHPLIHEYAGSYLAEHPRKVEMRFVFAAYFAGFAREYHGQNQRVESELPQLMMAARIACDGQNWRLLQPLWRVVSGALWRLSDWASYRRFDEKCLKVAQLAGERHVESRILSELGWVSLEEGSWEEADEFFQEAQFIVDDLTSTQQSVRLRRYRAILFTEQGQLEKAAVLLAEAEHLVERTAEIVQWSQSSRNRSLALLYHAYAGLALAAEDYQLALEKEIQAIGYCEDEYCESYRPMFDLRLGDIYYLSEDLEQAGCIWQHIIRHGAAQQPEQRIIAAAFLRMAQLAAYRGNRERALGWAYRGEQLFLESGLAEKARRAVALAAGLDGWMNDRPEVWPVFELWD
jgi:tetratricopeptide (TPR) repeat protein